MDTSKSFFQPHGVNAAEEPVLRKTVQRRNLIEFFRKLAPTEVSMEACGVSHHWARELTALGHRVKLIAPQLAKPYVERGKNDAADAEALCEAMSRPTMRFVPVKSADQQADLMLVGMRARLVSQRVELANAIRGTAAEFGHVAPKGLAHLAPLLAEIAADAAMPALARDLFAPQGKDHQRLVAEIKLLDRKILAWHRDNALSRKLRASGDSYDPDRRNAEAGGGKAKAKAPAAPGSARLVAA